MSTKTITTNTVLAALSSHIGKGHGICVGNLVYAITGKETSQSLERTVREKITELRLEGSHICASPKFGYFMAVNDEELEETCLFLFNRAMKSLAQISKMKKISLPDLRGQLKLLK